jgi:hypothetical protein
MNKLIHLHSVIYYDLTSFENMPSYSTSSDIDNMLRDRYGLNCMLGHRYILNGEPIDSDYIYKVTDESKFTLFMMKYSQIIKRIVYENNS